MKKLSDYQGDEAIELWADMIEPVSRIIMDENVARVYKSGMPVPLVVKEILKTHSNDATLILQRIDPTPVNGLNIITRLISVINEFMNNEDLRDFFVSAEQEKTGLGSTGSATVNTEAVET